MKKLIIFLWILFLSTKSLYAQTHQDSLLVYDNLKNWAITSMTIAYIQDFKDWSEETSIDRVQKGDLNEFKTYQSLYEVYFQLQRGNETDLEEFESELEKGWATTKDSVYLKYKDRILSSDSFFKDIPLYPFKESRTVNREATLKDIRATYSSDIKEYAPIKQVVKIHYEGEVNDYDNANVLDWVSYEIFIIFMLIGVVALLLIQKNKKKSNKRVSSGYKPKLGTREIEVSNLKITLRNRDNEISILKGRISELEIENTTIKNTNSQYNREPDNTPTEHIFLPDNDEVNGLTEVELNSNVKTYYLPAPFTEMRFAIEEGREMELDESLYKVVYDISTKKGMVQLIENANLSRALNSPYKYLEPVCIYENDYNSTAESISSNQVEILQDGEDWVITEKLKIKFI